MRRSLLTITEGVVASRISACSRKRTYAVQLGISDGASFNHLVGKRDECWGHFEAKSLGGLEIEHKFELGRLHDR